MNEGFEWDINKKVMVLFLLLSSIGIFILCQTYTIPDYGLRLQDFKINEIQKVVISKYPEKTELILTDSAQFKPIIEQILKGSEVKIKQPKANPTLYFLEIYQINDQIRKIHIMSNKQQGYCYSYVTTYYKNDSLLLELNSLNFTRE